VAHDARTVDDETEMVHVPSARVHLEYRRYGVSMDDVGFLSGVVLECRDPMEVARFYSALTGWQLVFTDDDFVAIGEDPDAAFNLGFQRAPAHEPPTWPDPRSSMQSHLHIKVRDLDAAERRVLELGGSRVSAQPASMRYRVVADPAGHPFCLVPAER
jgi:predicted enzyme related to lactoylglutathione lyase